MRKLVASLFLAVFFSLLGFGWAIDYYYSNTSQPSTSQDIEIYSGYRESLKLIVQHIKSNDLNNKQIEHYLQSLDIPVIAEPLTNYPLPPELMIKRDQNKVFLLESESGVTLHQLIGRHDLIASLGPVELKQENYTTRYILTLIFYAGIAAILLIWLIPLLKGIEQLTIAAQDIGQGKLATRITHPGRFYLAPLNNVFNAMAEKLQRLSDNNQILSQAVSHELRTPLSRLRFAVDLFETRKTEEQRTKDIERMSQDLDQMESLINELLLYARLDQQPTLSKEHVKFELFINDILKSWSNEKCKIHFQDEFSQRKVVLDRKYFSKVVNNILQNSCKYGNGTIEVSIAWKNESVDLIIEDNGSGISEEHFSNIFKPFTRIDNQKTKSKPGFGLGLAICQSIIKWHDGYIQFNTSKQLGGAKCIISLPLR